MGKIAAFRFGAAIIWAAVILFYSISPITGLDEVGETVARQDKTVHMISYGILTFLLVLGLSYGKGFFPSSFKIILLAAIASVLYGGIVEIFQFFIPGREASLLDFAANSIGAILAGFGIKVVGKIRYR